MFDSSLTNVYTNDRQKLSSMESMQEREPIALKLIESVLANPEQVCGFKSFSYLRQVYLFLWRNKQVEEG